MTAKINLLISDENRLFREGLRLILQNRNMDVMGDVRSLLEAIDELRGAGSAANLLLCNPSAEIECDFGIMREIVQEFPALKIVLLTDRIAHHWLDMAVNAGASGFLPKDISADALKFSLELVLLGERIFPTLHSLLAAKTEMPLPPAGPPLHSRQVLLSTRETQILGCLVDGLPNKTIARNLNMAEATVKVHLKGLLRKINVRNRTQAAIWGMNHTSGEPPYSGHLNGKDVGKFSPLS